MNKSNLSPIKGLGSDIIEIDRIRKSYEHHGARFLSRLFSPDEQNYCLQFKDPAPRLAARFSAKESVAKAIGTGFRGKLSWLDIEIRNDPLGKPYVLLSDALKKELEDPIILITISHCKLYASTTAIWVS
jgi:holo-[acyl-carrier protein] synthase